MPHVKSAVSIEECLFKEAEALAREMALSRSQLYAMALEGFIMERKNKLLLEEINAAYAEDAPAPDERNCQERMKEYHCRSVEGEW